MANKRKLNISKSNKIYKSAIKIIPSGGQTYSKGVTQFTEGFAPKYLDKGKGAYVTDVDGNTFLDYVMACQPLILGYSDKDVNKAVIQQLSKGTSFSLQNKLEVDVSKLLIKNIPSAEMVRFGKNGADATSIAVKIARAYTKRDHVAYCGYHGWHDWYISKTDLNGGIPKFNQKLLHSFNYNDLESLEKIFKKFKNKVAAVIMEPITVYAPKCYGPKNCKNKNCKIFCKKNFLKKVKDLANKNNALLIFDEIVTGFRYSIGGVQKLTNVTPDLTALAKAMSNGVPISAIVGKKKYMKCLEKTFFSFTYGGDCIGLAAAKASITKIKKLNVPNHLNKMGQILKDGLNKIIKTHELGRYFECIGYPCRSIFLLKGNRIFNELEMKTFLQQELFRRGILWAAYHSISYAHKKKEIDKTLKAFNQILKMFKNLFIEKKLKISSQLEGRVVKPVFRKVADFNSIINKKS
tara:strand:+ start:975 stop:2366 length:1392 start_codon:yes stop_codon:yes gene_type:complete